MKIVVTGASGDLGARVAQQLKTRGVEPIAASRRSGVDLTTGAGLGEVLTDADAVVHCADAPDKEGSVTVHGTRRLADAAAGKGVHLVHISIVGIDEHPMRYYQRKLQAEQQIKASGAAATVLRATQFHSLAAYFARALSIGPVTITFGESAFQPIDTDFVAERLTELALGPRPAAYTRAEDVAGPDLLTIPELAARIREHSGRSPGRTVRLPALGGVLRAFAHRANVPRPGTARTGGQTFDQWLATQPTVLSGR